MKITTKKVIEINRRFGGSLRKDSSLRFAESNCNDISSKYRCASIWIRAIVVDHSFSDANKRTSMIVVNNIIGIRNHMKIAKTIRKIAIESVNNVNKIEEMLKNANR